MLCKHGYRATLRVATGLSKHRAEAPVEYVPLLTSQGLETEVGATKSSAEQPLSPLHPAAEAVPASLLARAPAQREGREKRCELLGDGGAVGSSVGHILHGLLLLCSHGLMGPELGPWRCAERERFGAGLGSQAETTVGLGDNLDAEFAAAAGNASGARAEGQGRIPAPDHQMDVSPAAQLSAQIPPRGNELPAAPSPRGMPRSRAQPKHHETFVWMDRAALRTSTALQRGGRILGAPGTGSRPCPPHSCHQDPFLCGSL